jgi:CRP/FNR family transcriptional regulator
MTAVLTLLEKTVCMKSAEVFAAVPTEALARLAARATEMRVDRGQTVFDERDDDQGIFIVVEGAVELRKDDVVVRVLAEGAVHGELFLQEIASQQYTAIARGDACVLTLGRRDVFEALHEHPEFAVAMVRDLALRQHRLTERVIELERQLASGAPASDRSGRPDEIESPAPPPALPKWRGWWRLAARTTPKH